MAITATPAFIQTAKIKSAAFTNADAANTKKIVASGGANGTKVVGVFATSTDTAIKIAQLWLTRSATNYLLGSVTIPIAAGSDGATPAKNLLDNTIMAALPRDNDGQLYLFLESGDDLSVSTTTQVTAAKEIDATALYGNF